MPALLSEELTVTAYDFDPDVSTAVDVGWVDMSEYDSIMVVAVRAVGTGNTSAFKLLGNTAANGSGTDVTIKTVTISSEPNLVGDFVVVEATKEEIVAASENGCRYVSGNLTLATATDEFQVVYIRKAKTQKADNTVAVIA